MTKASKESTSTAKGEVERRLKAMREDELVDFIRDTVVRLDALADRLEVFADVKEEDGNA